MLHRVRIDLAFDRLSDALALYNHGAGVIAQAITINSGRMTEERGIITLEECGHDNDPPETCITTNQQQTPSGLPG